MSKPPTANGRNVGAALVALCLIAASAPPGPYHRIESAPGFRGWRAELQRMTDAEGPPGPNRFCVVVRGREPEEAQAYVLWRSKARLVTWGASREPISALSHAGSPLNLKTDVVPREADIRGSTYLVTKAWLRGVEDGCRRFGTTLILRRERR